ncbi:hypothetical protein TJA_05080 [Thermus sp. LT1-2-5]|uniref:hypothetical protein n=1 Tax=Thermus sp. LT1-2-5 TaxID=3026935 RepID=UPI0030EADB3C
MRKGIALISVLLAMVVILLLSLALSFWAQTNLATGRNLAGQAAARQRAEAGIDHALAYLTLARPQEALTLQGPGYTAILTPQGGGLYRVESRGTAGLAHHVAAALVAVETQPAQRTDPLFSQGWISGGRMAINGGVKLRGTRLHADKGYTNLTGQIQVCDAVGNNCRDLDQASPPPVTGGEGVADTQCNASGANRSVCQEGAPRYRACPVHQTPSKPEVTCADLLTGATVRWDQAHHIWTPDVDALSRATLGVRASSPYTDAVGEGRCHVSLTSLEAKDPDIKTLQALSGKELRICVQGNATLPSNLSLSRATFYVGGTFQVRSAQLEEVQVAAAGGINLGDVMARDSKFFTAGPIALNPNATFWGDSTLASRQSLTFQGKAELLNERALAIISERDITFNGLAEIHAFLWAGGHILFNGTGGLLGGAVSLGDVIQSGGGEFYIQRSQAQNSDLPREAPKSLFRPRVLYRR